MKQLIKDRNKIKEDSSLYDVFKLGDRVKRRYKNKSGKSREYEGIVLAIDKDNVEIYWDTIDGKYMPNEMNINFTNCSKYDIFKGSENYTSIEKEKSSFGYIYKYI